MRRSPEIEALVKAAAAPGADPELTLRMFSAAPDSVFIGTDSDEWWRGHDAISNAFQGDSEGASSDGARLDDVEAHEEGTVGWMVTRGSFVQGHARVPYRCTAVLHREQGEWKVVQSHVSVGVPNEEMFNPILRPARAQA